MERIEPDGKMTSNGNGAREAVAASREAKLYDLYIRLRSPDRETVFLTTAAAAEIAGVRDRTIRQWINEGKIEAVQPFKQHRVYLPSLTARLKARS